MAESIEHNISPYDHAPRFAAFSEHEAELTARLERLLAGSEPQAVEVDDPEGHILLSAEEISRIWGLFPASARARAVPNPPIVKSDTPRWFAHGSSSAGPVITDKVEEALSPTSHGLAHVDREEAGAIITVHEIPENGYSKRVRRLVQAGVLVHELTHNIVGTELWNTDPEYRLVFPSGNLVLVRDWSATFARAVEQYPPISHYSSAYRDENNMFPRQNDALVIGVGVEEELVDSITAELLGFIVNSHGLSFEPFKGREEIREDVRAYLAAQSAASASRV